MGREQWIADASELSLSYGSVHVETRLQYFKPEARKSRPGKISASQASAEEEAQFRKYRK